MKKWANITGNSVSEEYKKIFPCYKPINHLTLAGQWPSRHARNNIKTGRGCITDCRLVETLTSETGPTDPEASASSVTDQRDTSCELGEDLKFSFEMDGYFGQCLMLLFFYLLQPNKWSVKRWINNECACGLTCLFPEAWSSFSSSSRSMATAFRSRRRRFPMTCTLSWASRHSLPCDCTSSWPESSCRLSTFCSVSNSSRWICCRQMCVNVVSLGQIKHLFLIHFCHIWRILKTFWQWMNSISLMECWVKVQ